MIAVSEKYALEVSSPTPIASERQHEEYLSVLDNTGQQRESNKRRREVCRSFDHIDPAYEEEHHSIPDASPIEILRTLMDANDLRQKDLVSIFGSESIVSEVLHKKRGLNKTHIEKLSKRFRISPAVFF